MFSPEEYRRYNALKAASEFGRELEVEEFRAARKRKLAWVKDIIKGHPSVCDYGAGSGWLREMCDELGITCIEVDEIADKGSFARIQPVDIIVSITVLEHMTPGEVVRFIDTCKEKGRCILLVTNNPRCAFSHYVLWDDITHVRMYTEESIAALLRCKG